MGRITTVAIRHQIWSFRNNKIYGVRSKPFTHARLIFIGTLQFKDHLVKPRITSSHFGQDSLLMIDVILREEGDAFDLVTMRILGPTPSPSREWPFILSGIVSARVSVEGGIIMNHLWEFIGAFAGPIGPTTCRVANVQALRKRAELSNYLKSFAFDIWSTSTFLLDNVTLTPPLWNCTGS